MAIMLDADVVIRGEKGIFDLAAWLTSRPDDDFEMAAITVAELRHGVERAKKGKQRTGRERYLKAITSVLPIIPYTEKTAYEHARLWAHLQSAGTMIGYYDAIVAASALERGSKVATFNRRHFDRVPGLAVIEPA